MDKISCNIVKDLLPSYIDGICSEDSGRLVEEHLKKCNACRRLVEMMSAAELVAEHTGDRQIDYMKKVRQQYTKKNILSFGLMLICLLSGLILEVNSYRLSSANLYYCYIFVPIIMTGTYLMMLGQRTEKRHGKWELVMGGIGILLIVYCIALGFLAAYGIGKPAEGVPTIGIYPPDKKAGQLLHWQLLVIIGLSLIMLAAAITASLKTGIFHSILIDITACGGCMAFAFRIMLAKLTTLEGFKQMWTCTFWVILLEGIFMAVLVLWLEKRQGSY